jgi:hypothetical protein
MKLIPLPPFYSLLMTDNTVNVSHPHEPLTYLPHNTLLTPVILGTLGTNANVTNH